MEPDESEDQAYHPYRYYSRCRECDEERSQAPWQRALLKAWQSSPGPKTPEGIKAVTANLEGHPTPDEALRTRFNAMKHGLNAKVATYFPAKPDGYAFCASCEVDRTWCAEQPACVKRAESFMLHHAAFEQKDPKKLNGLYASMQAALFATLEQILQTIIADGVKLTKPEYYIDKDGVLHLAEFYDVDTNKMHRIMEISSHPLFKPLGELISRVGLSLSDMGITQRTMDAHDNDGELGQLKAPERPPADDYRERQTKALENLVGLVERSQAKTATDPILIEYNEQQGESA